jgi:hypothetical protein
MRVVPLTVKSRQERHGGGPQNATVRRQSFKIGLRHLEPFRVILTATLRRFALRSSESVAPFAFRLASIFVWMVRVTAGALPSASARDLLRSREGSMAS